MFLRALVDSGRSEQNLFAYQNRARTNAIHAYRSRPISVQPYLSSTHPSPPPYPGPLLAGLRPTRPPTPTIHTNRGDSLSSILNSVEARNQTNAIDDSNDNIRVPLHGPRTANRDHPCQIRWNVKGVHDVPVCFPVGASSNSTHTFFRLLHCSLSSNLRNTGT